MISLYFFFRNLFPKPLVSKIVTSRTFCLKKRINLKCFLHLCGNYKTSTKQQNEEKQQNPRAQLSENDKNSSGENSETPRKEGAKSSKGKAGERKKHLMPGIFMYILYFFSQVKVQDWIPRFVAKNA